MNAMSSVTILLTNMVSTSNLVIATAAFDMLFAHVHAVSARWW
jgi:hypothetical protein